MANFSRRKKPICNKIFQTIVMEIDDGKCVNAQKLKAYDDGVLHEVCVAHKL